MKTYLLLFAIFIFSSFNEIRIQSAIVSGTVSSAEDSQPLPGVSVLVKGTKIGTVTNINGEYSIEVTSEKAVLIFSYIGFTSVEVAIGARRHIDIKLEPDMKSLSEVVVTGYSSQKRSRFMEAKSHAPAMESYQQYNDAHLSYNTEEYATIHDNSFLETNKNPLSTFSIDVDNASYSNIRRYINLGQSPPKDAVRIEEMINYFTYDYPQPKGDDPFSVNLEVSECPWNKNHNLVHIGLQGKEISKENLPTSNLVFLIDVSGSMDTPERLPLVKTAFKMLVDELRPQDHVSIVVYAGAAGLVLPPTSGKNKKAILDAIHNLEAGGSTAGGAGIHLAYNTAKSNFKLGGNNRVILATDGDFNIGVSSNAEMERLIEKKKESGIFLTVLGFGMGNYKDSKMEILANKGNGNYAYIDNVLEAKKVFVTEFGGTLFTIAKDVKLQVEFNPEKIKGYRLIGYENRMLKSEDFNNDKKDAGDMGSGHTVTALYEVIPAEIKNSPYIHNVDKLKYQKIETIKKSSLGDELLHVKVRYKDTDGMSSRLIEQPLANAAKPFFHASENLRFSVAVASFGMLLRDSEYKGAVTYQDVVTWAKGSKGKDDEGYRAEFIKLVLSSALVASK
ncbi:MAG: von Willebrand factor type A domain-containing protein [Bacteroidota bacterium]|nr:von Willebrand factor type A domain-containing protein [Bacteroidota bacterium]